VASWESKRETFKSLGEAGRRAGWRLSGRCRLLVLHRAGDWGNRRQSKERGDKGWPALSRFCFCNLLHQPIGGCFESPAESSDSIRTPSLPGPGCDFKADTTERHRLLP